MYLPDFFWKYRRLIALVALLCLSCLFMVDSLHRRWVARSGSQAILGLAWPIQKTSQGVYDGGRNVLSAIPDFFRTRAQNVILRRRVGELEQEIVALREQVLQEQRLHRLLDATDRIETPKIIARVIGTNPTAWFSTVMVDKGSSHGVRRYMPALSSSGLAGHVIEVFPYSSKVLLLTDSNSKVSIVVQKSRAQGVVQGDDEGRCVLKYLEPTADIKKGDIVVTSGNSRIYTKGLLVGYVDELKNEPGKLFQWARVVPATDFKNLEEIAILITADAPEAASEGAPTAK
ncbi:MAG: rod shape-determining protein MreC [Candidatus Hydrogenedentota bacterium]|nr:MAG: rod shape-determining protein MreC [Candidatus Hydrogenedentota bacterium]